MTAEFNPFTDRPSRDLRNRLGFRFVDSLCDGNDTWLQTAADEFADFAEATVLHAYLEDRIQRYGRVISLMNDGSVTVRDVYGVAAILWREGLYFECHEWLEQLWKTVSGVEKQVLQALIRTAGACELARYNRMDAARSTAAKALEILTLHPDRLPVAFDGNAIRSRLSSLGGHKTASV